MADDYQQAIEQAVREYKGLYTKDLKFVKKADARAEVMRGVASRARDIYRENMAPTRKFSFTISAFDVDKRLWDRCPGCGDPLINRDSNGHAWQGCYKCDVLLGSNGVIQSMDHTKGKKPKEEPFGAKVEGKT
jgi:hypothetical protein